MRGVIGIQKSVESKDFDYTVCKVFNSIGSDIGEDRIKTFTGQLNQKALLLRFPKGKSQIG